MGKRELSTWGVMFTLFFGGLGCGVLIGIGIML